MRFRHSCTFFIFLCILFFWVQPISGARALVPVLLPHVKSILQEPSSLTTSVATVMAAQSGAAAQSVSMVSTPVRRASLQLLGSILGLYARLIPATKQLEASEGADSVSTESWRALSKMRHHLIGVPNLLMNAMACEKCVSCCKYLLSV